MKLVFCALLSTIGISAMADIQAVQPGTKEETVANAASNVFSVTNFKLGKYAYQVVSMDSELNGDVSSTTILLVGEGGVGGEAGYEAAFQLSPVHGLNNLKSAKVEKGQIALAFYDIDGKVVKKIVSYDPATKTLKEAK